MIYLKEFSLNSVLQEDEFLQKFNRTCFDSYYPYRLFPHKGIEDIDFADITIFCGGNGSGKSTILNIIAEKLGITRTTPYNKTYFFDPYLDECEFEIARLSPDQQHAFKSRSKIITSDDVFNHIINVRKSNENLAFKRQLIFDQKREMETFGWQGPKGFSADDPESIKAYRDYYRLSRLSASRYVRQSVGVEERTYSNGENGFKYFTDAIQPEALYLLDEPENSLSAEMQMELVQFILGMARFYECQFIISTHSPFLLSLPFAKIFNLDANPVEECKWTELPCVRAYHDFFEDHKSEFE